MNKKWCTHRFFSPFNKQPPPVHNRENRVAHRATLQFDSHAFPSVHTFHKNSFNLPFILILRVIFPATRFLSFIKIPLKLSPLLLFLETKRISPPAQINKIREEEGRKREEEKEDGARILSSFLSLKRIIYQSPISKSEDTSCDPLGHPWSEQGLDTNRGTRGLARK